MSLAHKINKAYLHRRLSAPAAALSKDTDPARAEQQDNLYLLSALSSDRCLPLPQGLRAIDDQIRATDRAWTKPISHPK
ncbi:MAG TPA: hypothetical protein VHS31_17675 [Tepidisphaeraceae bacterium]|jgi:hypothetical protein|nr:hypothetical protein [Tepidisphaeraceae bacterium]